jgi:hypothetical protein
LTQHTNFLINFFFSDTVPQQGRKRRGN